MVAGTALNKILVVDDDRTTRLALQHMLARHGYEVTTADNGLEATELIERMSFSLVLTDWTMPEMDGEALCKWIRARDCEEYVYVMVLTAASEKADLTRGFDAGADDYVTKPFDEAELLARLRVGARILRLQEDMLATEQRLRQIADRDGLTDLLNRRALDARLSEAFSFFRRRSRPLSIALLDLDHFKRINDDHGHPAGDAVLRETSRRVAEAVRAYDTLGRFGGEEFMLILPDTLAWSARLVAERVRQVLNQRPVAYEDRKIPISGSLGVATLDVGFRGNLQTLIDAADNALYEAKHRGRNRVVSITLGTEGRIERPAPTIDLVDPRSTASLGELPFGP